MDGKALKSFREEIGLSQVEFGRLIGRSYASVQGYESGRSIPVAVAQRVASLIQRGITIPPSVGIDSEAEKVHADSTGTSRPEDAGPRSGGDSNARWHLILEEVLNSGIEEALTAVQSNLVLFGNYVRDKAPLQKKLERKKAK